MALLYAHFNRVKQYIKSLFKRPMTNTLMQLKFDSKLTIKTMYIFCTIGLPDEEGAIGFYQYEGSLARNF